LGFDDPVALTTELDSALNTVSNAMDIEVGGYQLRAVGPTKEPLHKILSIRMLQRTQEAQGDRIAFLAQAVQSVHAAYA